MSSFNYRGPYAYHVILLTQARAAYFADLALVGRCTERLRQSADRLNFRLLAFCFMPDHLHVLVQGRDDGADLISFVKRFKQVTAFHFKRESGMRLWRQSFYDRVLRVEDDRAGVAGYILANPIRAGAGTETDDCLLSGGEYFERTDLKVRPYGTVPTPQEGQSDVPRA